MIKFEKGRRYRNNKTYLVEDRTAKSVELKTKDKSVSCSVEKDKIKEYCYPENGMVLKATSLVGRPQHYTDEENHEIRKQASRAFNERAYKTVTFNLEPELAKELKEAAKKTGVAQRQIVMMAVKEWLERNKNEKGKNSEG